MFMESRRLGDRSKCTDKMKRDIAVLLKGVEEEPDNERYMFYLAQSYRDDGQIDKAVEWYKTCAIHDKWDEEKFFAEYQAGWAMCHLPQKYSAVEISKQLMHAWLSRPWRVEPLYQLAMMYKDTNNWHQAYSLLRICASTPYPANDVLFIGAGVYEGMSLDEFSIAAYWSGHYDEAIVACNQLISMNIPYSHVHRQRILKNRWYSEKALGHYSSEKLMEFIKTKKYQVKILVDNNYQLEEK
jgi:tetratricopeptide (TPR) repeat protein